MACNNCGCGSKKNPLAEKVSQNIEKYKILEILRKLRPVAEKIAHHSGKSLEKVFQEDLKNPLREALEFEFQGMEGPEKEKLLHRFEEDFHHSLMIQLGRAAEQEGIPSDQIKVQWRIRLCTGPTCSLKGSEVILSALEESLNLRRGEVSKDQKILIETLECTQACRQGPNLLINDKFHSHQNPEEALSLVEDTLSFRRGGGIF